MDLNIAAARFALNKLSTDQAIDVASSALDSGRYSDSLGQLMSQLPVWSEVGPIFKKALAELNIAIPPRAQAILILARDYARQIVMQELSPYEGARRIWWELANEPDADQSLLDFVGLASEWEDAPQYRVDYDADIVEEARRLLAKNQDETPLA